VYARWEELEQEREGGERETEDKAKVKERAQRRDEWRRLSKLRFSPFQRAHQVSVYNQSGLAKLAGQRTG
jgi:hypothetical protein